MKSRTLKQNSVFMYEIKATSANKYRPSFLNLLTKIEVKLNNNFPQPVLRWLLSFQSLRRAVCSKAALFFTKSTSWSNECSTCPYKPCFTNRKSRISLLPRREIKDKNVHLDWHAPSRALEVCQTYCLVFRTTSPCKFEGLVRALGLCPRELRSWEQPRQKAQVLPHSLQRNVPYTASGKAPSNICSLHSSPSAFCIF